MKLFARQLTQRSGSVLHGGSFNSLTCEQFRAQLHTLILSFNMQVFEQQPYASHSFRIGVATIAVAAGLPA